MHVLEAVELGTHGANELRLGGRRFALQRRQPLQRAAQPGEVSGPDTARAELAGHPLQVGDAPESVAQRRPELRTVDELRDRIESSALLRAAKRGVNAALSLSGLGEGLECLGRRDGP